MGKGLKKCLKILLQKRTALNAAVVEERTGEI